VLLRGLFIFYAICALGTVANVGIAGYVFSKNEVWWLAGLAGVVVGSVWKLRRLVGFHLEAKLRLILTGATPGIGWIRGCSCGEDWPRAAGRGRENEHHEA
jgi:hypothetical protein